MPTARFQSTLSPRSRSWVSSFPGVRTVKAEVARRAPGELRQPPCTHTHQGCLLVPPTPQDILHTEATTPPLAWHPAWRAQRPQQGLGLVPVGMVGPRLGWGRPLCLSFCPGGG